MVVSAMASGSLPSELISIARAAGFDEDAFMHRLACMAMAAFGAGLALVGAARARAEIPPGWTLYPLDGRPAMQAAPSGTDGVRLQGEGAVSLAVKPVPAAWLSPGTCLSWRWRVDAGPPSTDLTQRGEDDRAIALWVGFRAEAEAMTLAQRYAFGMIRFLSPVSDPPGFILAYTWGGRAPSDRWEGMPQPFLGQIVRQRVLRANGYGQGWVEETVPLSEDFRRAYGVPATPLMQIAVFADGDNTHSRTDVAVEGMHLVRCASGDPQGASHPAPELPQPQAAGRNQRGPSRNGR
jgi:hypothetical protein